MQGFNLGYGYKANQGVINVEFVENAETLLGISEEEIEVGVHIMNLL